MRTLRTPLRDRMEWVKYPLDQPDVAAHLRMCHATARRIVLHKDGAWMHYTAHKDEDGYFVYHGNVRHYLMHCVVTIHNGKPELYEFS